MHAVLIKVTVNDPEAGRKTLHEQVVPRVKQAPGFVAGYWMGTETNGQSVVILESEETANAMAQMARDMAPPTVTLESIEVQEVVAHA